MKKGSSKNHDKKAGSEKAKKLRTDLVENLRRFKLALYRCNGVVNAALQRAELSREWKSANQKRSEFTAIVEEVQARIEEKHLRHMNKAARNSDWRASHEILKSLDREKYDPAIAKLKYERENGIPSESERFIPVLNLSVTVNGGTCAVESKPAPKAGRGSKK